MRKRRRRWIALGVLVVLGALCGWFFTHRTLDAAGSSGAGSTTDVPVLPNVRLVIARAGNFFERVTVQGRVGPPAGSSVKIAFAQAGILHALNAKVGQSVAMGQPLAELDRATLGVAVAQVLADDRGNHILARTAVRQAEAKIGVDQALIARNELLLAGGVIAAKDLEAARAQLRADRADRQAALEQSQATSASAQEKLAAARIGYTNGLITAPSSGVVLALFKHPGEAVDPTTPILEIGPPNAREVTLSVPADVARRIRVGDSAVLQVPQTHERIEGSRVTAVVPADDPTTQAATVVLSGAPPDAVPGDAVTAVIVVARISGVLVPSSAIIQDPQTGKTVVFVRNTNAKPPDACYTMREVEVRASDPTSAVVVRGLRPGERIAGQGGYELLAPAGN